MSAEQYVYRVGQWQQTATTMFLAGLALSLAAVHPLSTSNHWLVASLVAVGTLFAGATVHNIRKRWPKAVWLTFGHRLALLGFVSILDHYWKEAAAVSAILYVLVNVLWVWRESIFLVIGTSIVTGFFHLAAHAAAFVWPLHFSQVMPAVYLALLTAIISVCMRALLLQILAVSHLTEQRLEATEQLAAAGTLATMAAHEIRVPLTSVKGFLQMLQRRLQKEEDRQWVELIRGDVDRVERLVREFLVLGSPRQPRLTDVTVGPLLEEAIRTVFLSLQFSPHEHATIDCDHDLTWTFDREHLRQVLVNLVRNAADAMGPNGKMHIKAYIEAGKLIIMVCDNGPGIAPELLDQVSEPFFTTKRNGTGLGLAICHRLIEDHDGEFLLQSEPNSGTTVIISLPNRATEPAPTTNLPARSAKTPVRRLRLLQAPAPRAREGHL